MRTNTKRLLVSAMLIGFALALAACTLPAPKTAEDVSAAQTLAVVQTQMALSTPTLSPTPTNTATPTATLDPIFVAQTAQSLALTQALTASPTITPSVKPGVYVLQAGEYPWCIARRFNVDPKELLRVNNLSSGLVYQPGLSLTIPQGTSGFPAPRALQPHPTTYTVPQSNMTVYAVACYFGDVDPLAIIQANGLTSPILALGTVLKIP
jgi:LysM repeat protein